MRISSKSRHGRFPLGVALLALCSTATAYVLPPPIDLSRWMSMLLPQHQAVSPVPPQKRIPRRLIQLEFDPQYPLVKPRYPEDSRRRGEQGSVQLLIYVEPDGAVGEVRVRSSSGYSRLDRAAMTQIRHSWRFKPALKRGEPAGVWGTYIVTFKLDSA